MNNFNHYSEQFSERFPKSILYSKNLEETVVDCVESPDRFGVERFNQFSLLEIHNYIFLSHTYYRDYWIPRIESTIHQFKNYRPRLFQVIDVTFKHFKSDLLEHMSMEEKLLLPIAKNQIDEIQNSIQDEMMLINFINSHNDHILLDLEKLFAELELLESGVEDDLGYRIFKVQFKYLQQDLFIHSKIEDEVYVKKVLCNLNRV